MLYLTPMHAAIDKLMVLIANIRAALTHVKAAAEQLPKMGRWQIFVDCVVAKIARPLPPWQSPQPLNATGSLPD
jgi:hypothetical protein